MSFAELPSFPWTKREVILIFLFSYLSWHIYELILLYSYLFNIYLNHIFKALVHNINGIILYNIKKSLLYAKILVNIINSDLYCTASTKLLLFMENIATSILNPWMGYDICSKN